MTQDGLDLPDPTDADRLTVFQLEERLRLERMTIEGMKQRIEKLEGDRNHARNRSDRLQARIDKAIELLDGPHTLSDIRKALTGKIPPPTD